MALALIVRLPTHRPWEMLRIAPFGCAGRDKKLRHLLGIAVFMNRGISRRAERIEQQQHAVAFDQLAHLFDRLRRAVAVVIRNEIDPAAVYPALLVDHVEKGGLRLADHAIGRGRAAIRVRVAYLDLGVARAGVVFLLRESRRRTERDRARHRSEDRTAGQMDHCWTSVRVGERRCRVRFAQASARRANPAAPDGMTKMTSSMMAP